MRLFGGGDEFILIAGFFMPILTTVQTVYVQEITEPDVLGRVFL